MWSCCGAQSRWCVRHCGENSTHENNPEGASATVRGREEEETIGQSEQHVELCLNDDINSVILAIRDGTGTVTYLKIKKSSKMSKLMKGYAKLKDIDYSSLRFFNGGERVSDDDTPEILELCDQDQIDVMLEQCGC